MPLPTSGNRKVFCVIVGGFGREPINKKILSVDSLLASEKNGPCLTIAHVPTWDVLVGNVRWETVKIFSQPVKHPRETVAHNINLFYPSNPSSAKPRGT